MSDTDATTSPTPNNMPGVTAVTRASLGGEQTVDYSQSNQDLTADDGGSYDTADQDGADLVSDDLVAERDKWKRQAQTNEKRAKANADKAKAYDADFEKFKAAYEREQANQKAQESVEPAVEDEAASRAADAEARAAEAEAKLLRFKLADGVPEWAIGLIDGESEEEIESQVETLKEHLAAYVASVSEPRRPAPNPLAGRGGQLGSSPQEAFQSAFSTILR